MRSAEMGPCRHHRHQFLTADLARRGFTPSGCRSGPIPISLRHSGGDEICWIIGPECRSLAAQEKSDRESSTTLPAAVARAM